MLRHNPLPVHARTQTVDARTVPSVRPRALERSNVFHYFMLLYLFLFCTRIQEFVPQVRLSAVLLILLLAGAAVTMRATAILRMPSGKLLIAFTLWVGLCVPFSVWMGGSADVFRGNVQGLLIVVFMAAFIQTLREAVHAMYVIGLAMAFAACMSFVAGSEQGGRLALGDGTLNDPNFYCLFVLTGLPFLLLMVSIGTGITRVTGAVLIIPVLVVFAKTGSRMGVVALAAGLIFLFLVSSFTVRIYLAVATGIIIAIGIFALPDTLVKRVTTLFHANEGGADAAMAADSSNIRKHLLLRSLEMTAKHPILGLGPGMFTIGEAEDAKAKGHKGAWHVTHNTYTQLSSEVGIPGALMFVWVLFINYRGLSRIRRAHSDARARKGALFTQMSLVIVSVAACFLSVGYAGIPYVVVGLSGTFLTAVAHKSNLATQRALTYPAAQLLARSPAR